MQSRNVYLHQVSMINCRGDFYCAVWCISSLLTRLVGKHLSNGKYDATNVSLIAETKSVLKTNTISERDFAQLDRFLREKPNALILSLEALILLCNNKTASWLNDKSPAEHSELLHKVRSSLSGLKQQYQFQRKKLIEDHVKLLQAK